MAIIKIENVVASTSLGGKLDLGAIALALDGAEYEPKQCMARTKWTMTVTVDPKVIEWLDKMVRQKTFRNRSHGVEFCLAEMRKKTGT